MTYLIWDPDGCDESDAGEIEASSRSEAAQIFAERDDWSDARDRTSRTYHVRDVDGRLWSVPVTYMLTVAFSTGEPVRVEESR